MTEIEFSPYIIKNYFTLKAVEACSGCKRYGLSRCPPRIPSIDYYKELLPSYKNGLIAYETFDILHSSDWKELGKLSSLKIHVWLLDKRQELLNKGRVYIIGLGAGSCKWCEKCSYPCVHPDKSFVPLEGCGIDVVALMQSLEIDISFPVEKQGLFYRVGLLLWD